MTGGTLTCASCGRTFDLPARLRERYPGWAPRQCPSCYDGTRASGKGGDRPSGGRSRQGPIEANLTLEEVLDTHAGGPTSGVFTDGSAQPNPGPGGWGAVYVVDDEIIDQAHGHEQDTTNNRMELTAALRGGELVPAGVEATIYTDSRYVHDTITKWAAGWKRRGWKRKRGKVENLDLVKALYEYMESRPELDIAWVPAHSGYRWNEYADSLSTAWTRDRL